MNKLGIGVISCGKIACHYAAGINKSRNGIIKMVMDVNLEIGKDLVGNIMFLLPIK